MLECLALGTHHGLEHQRWRVHTEAVTFLLFSHQEPGLVQHCHPRDVLNSILVQRAFWNLPTPRLQGPHAHLRVVIAASIRHCCLQQLYYTAIDVARGFEGFCGSKEASTDRFCGSLLQTPVCTGKAVQSITCWGTTSALIWTSPDGEAVIMCLQSVWWAQVASEFCLWRQNCRF